jgi:hypothetical protein
MGRQGRNLLRQSGLATMRRTYQKRAIDIGALAMTKEKYITLNDGTEILAEDFWLRAPRHIIEKFSEPANIPLHAPSGIANLRAILADQPFQNSALSVLEINLILDNEGGFMPDEAVAWFRGARGTFGTSTLSPSQGDTP